ncbi:MAG: amidase family protein, partial [Bacillota bacterium]|nr:amidase family protein [Bacillota bacterium]
MLLLQEGTIHSLQQAMEIGKLSSRELVLYYMDRIARFSSSGPKLNAVLELNPDAVYQAEALDQERRHSGPRGALHGIPVLLKDNIDTWDKLHTSAGSIALADSYATEDAFLVSQLRAAGAIILGKANMTEWANFMTQDMPSGYSSRGGQVLSPYGPGKFDVGGSSSGSASAVAADLVTVAVGTETWGSILSPASSNSIVGIKPTVGLISRSGIIPISHSQDTAGPMAKTVEDAAVLLSAMTGWDERDPVTFTSQGKSYTDYTQFLNPHALNGARIGVARAYYKRLDADGLEILARSIAALQQAGAIIIDPIEIPSESEKMDTAVLVYEFKPALNAYLGRLAPHVPIHTLFELIEFNKRSPDRMLKYGQTLLEEAEQTSGSLTEPEYVSARLRDLRLTREQGLDYVMAQHR